MADYPRDVRQRFTGTPEQHAAGLVGEPPPRWHSIVIEDHDPGWAGQFEVARAALAEALGDQVVRVEHVGSTSVPGLAAKPVIDIDLTLRDNEDESRYVPVLAKLGYRLVLREPWWFGHRMLARDDVNLHVWPRDAPEPVRHRLFRDWLRSHPEDRELYASAKRRIAGEVGAEDYGLAKSDVIDQIFTRIFAAPR